MPSFPYNMTPWGFKSWRKLGYTADMKDLYKVKGDPRREYADGASFVPLLTNLDGIYNEALDIYKALIESNKFKKQHDCVVSLEKLILNPNVAQADKDSVVRLATEICVACTPYHELNKAIRRRIFRRCNAEYRDQIVLSTIGNLLDIVVENQKMLLTFTFMEALISIQEFAKSVEHHARPLFKLTLSYMRDLLDINFEEIKEQLKKDQMVDFVDATSRFLLLLLPDGKVNEIVDDEDVVKLITYCYQMMAISDVSIHIKNNFGYTMVLVFNELQDHYREECVYKNYPYLDLLIYDKGTSKFLRRTNIMPMSVEHLNDSFQVCIYGSILLMQESVKEMLQETIDGKSIVHFLFDNYSEIAKKGCKKVLFVKSLLVGFNTLSVLIYDFDKAPLYIKNCLNLMTIYADVSDSIVNELIRKILADVIKTGLDKIVYFPCIINWVSDLPIVTIRYTAISEMCKTIGVTYLVTIRNKLFRQLLLDVICCSHPTMVVSCIATLMECYAAELKIESDANGLQEWTKYCVDEIISFLRTENRAPFSRMYRKILVIAFRVTPMALIALSKENLFKSDNELCAFLECVQMVKENKMYPECRELVPIMRTMEANNLIDSLIIYNNDEVRKLILKFCAASGALTDEYKSAELTFIEKFFYFNINTTRPALRNEFVSVLKQVFDRLHHSFEACKKVYEREPEKLNVLNSNYFAFRKGIMQDTLLAGLYRSCNHTRRNACLEILHYLVCREDKEKYISILTPKDVGNIRTIIILDTYDQNKIWAANLLCIMNPPCLGAQLSTTEKALKQIDECVTIAKSYKAGTSVTAAFLLKIYLKTVNFNLALREKVLPILKSKEVDLNDNHFLLLTFLIHFLNKIYVECKNNLAEITLKVTIHGFIICIRYLLQDLDLKKKGTDDQWKSLFQDLITCCLKLSEIVNPIVCNPSPEGASLEDCENEESEDIYKSQRITLFGWKAVKEISMIFGEISSAVTIAATINDNGLITEAHLKEIGQYFFYLLLNSKHKGAFEQASIGFSKFCSKLWQLPNLRKLPIQWMEEIGKIIDGTSDADVETCATRRSAGIPFMVQAILITEPNGDALFRSTMNLMLETAEDVSKPEEQRIHAFNILKTLYRHSKLNRAVLPYCMHGMIAAVNGFKSDKWGIRNSATLLCSAVMIRIFGPRILNNKENSPSCLQTKMAAKLFLANYKELYLFMYSELCNAVVNKEDDTLYPVLLLFSQLSYYSESNDALRRTYLMKCVDVCLHHTSYQIRDLAAKVYIQLTRHSKLDQYIAGCFIRLSNPMISDSYCHGTLLQLQYMLDLRVDNILDEVINKYKYNSNNLNVAEIIDGTGWILLCCPKYISHLTASVYIDVIMHLILRYDSEFKNCDIFNHVTMLLLYHIKLDEKHNLVSVGYQKFRTIMFQLKLYMNFHVEHCLACDKKWKLVYSQHKIFERDLRHHMFLQDQCVRYLHFIKLTIDEFDWIAQYEEEQILYIEPILRLLSKINVNRRKQLHSVIYESLIKLSADKREEIVVAQYTKPVFYEMLAFYDYPLYILTSHYKNTNKLVLTHILSLCAVSEKRIAYQAMTWLDHFVHNLKIEQLKFIDLSNVAQLLYKWSLPSNEFTLRYGVSKFLVHNRIIFHREDWILNYENLILIWATVFVLLEDDAEEIRNIISQLTFYDVESVFEDKYYLPVIGTHIPSSARRNIIHFMPRCMPTQCVIALLVYLILRPAEKINYNNTNVFNEGELNLNLEIYPIAKEATKMLMNIFSKMTGGVQFESTSYNTLSDRPFHIAFILHDLFYRNKVPFLGAATRESMRKICTTIIAFMACNDVTQEHVFIKYREILGRAHLIKQAETLQPCDKNRMRMFLTNIFNHEAYVKKDKDG